MRDIRVNHVAGDLNTGDQHGDRFRGDQNNYYGAPAAPKPRTIVVLNANAVGHPLLQLDQERRAIDRVVHHSAGDTRLEVRTADAVRLDDLQPTLMRYRPVVVHFSGHGHPNDGIQVVDEFGQARSVNTTALSNLFSHLNDGLRCVVLNACYTDKQANEIAKHVPCVVGMRRQILDQSAITFATGFYRALAHGLTIRKAFELAQNELDLHEMSDSDVPRLIAHPAAADRPLIDPS
jgi:hypothetical protein